MVYKRDAVGRHRPDINEWVQGSRQMLYELQQLETCLNRAQYARLDRTLRLLMDELEIVLRQDTQLLEGAPPLPSRIFCRNREGVRQLQIDEDKLLLHFNAGMEDDGIARVLGCSRRTVIRRREELGLKKRLWTELSDDELIAVC